MKKERIKQVDGVKVVYRYSPAVIFMALFGIIVGGAPFLMLLPQLSVFSFIPASGDPYVVTPLNMYSALMFWDEAFLMQHPIIALVATNVTTPAFANQVTLWVFFALTLTFYLSALFGVILALISLIVLFAGKFHKFGLLKNLAWTSTVFSGVSAGLCWGFIGAALFLHFDGLEGAFNCMYESFIFGGQFFLTIIMSIIASAKFKNFVFYDEIGEMRRPTQEIAAPSQTIIYQGSQDGGQQTTQIIEKEVVVYKTQTTLPAQLSRIANHEFATNTNLKDAQIPHGIPSIGVGAFANCVNLETVSIPVSVKEIGSNAFFNCASLKTINYMGTAKQWAKVKRGTNWLYKAGTNVVNCTDASLIVKMRK